MTRTENSVNTCIIITEVQVDTETVVPGAPADAAQEVLAPDAEHIAPMTRTIVHC